MPWDDPVEEEWIDAQFAVPEAPMLEVEENPEVGRLYGPTGDLITIVRARATIPFGPQPRGDRG